MSLNKKKPDKTEKVGEEGLAGSSEYLTKRSV